MTKYEMIKKAMADVEDVGIIPGTSLYRQWQRYFEKMMVSELKEITYTPES